MLIPPESHGIPTPTTPTRLETKVQADMEGAVAAENASTVTMRSTWTHCLYIKAEAAEAVCILTR